MLFALFRQELLCVLPCTTNKTLGQLEQLTSRIPASPAARLLACIFTSTMPRYMPFLTIKTDMTTAVLGSFTIPIPACYGQVCL